MSDMEMTTTNTALTNETEADKLARLAAEINTIKAQTLAVVQNATLEIGKRLIQAKGAVGHGNWSQWLKDNVDYSERTAQNIISIYERFGNGQQKLFGASADPEQVAKLNRSQMLALMSIKDEEQCFEFMEEHKEDLQDMSKRELEAAIKELNEVKAKSEEKDKRLNQAHDDMARIREKYEQDMKALQDKLAETGDNEELSSLKEKLAEMEKKAAEEKKQYDDSFSQLNTEINNRIKDLNEAREAIQELKKENEAMKNAPVEAAVVEKVPEETLKEMDALKAKIAELEKAKPEKSKEEKAFARHFENIREELQAAVECLGRLDGDKAEKCRGIFKKMLEATINAV
jgi:myosin heavy subunit